MKFHVISSFAGGQNRELNGFQSHCFVVIPVLGYHVPKK